MNDEVDAYHALCAYTLGHGGPEFIHQYVVDAWAAQHAGPDSKPISVTFALIGLHLSVDKGWSGRQVQLAHMQLARRKHVWPRFTLPEERGAITALDVMRVPEGDERDDAIRVWCRSVWAAYAVVHAEVSSLLAQHGILPR